MARPAISLVIIALNEAHNIERCIRSAPWVDEVLVLDSGSQDGTVELAQKLGARVVVEKWRGFRDQKNRAVELAQHDWILSLDADEAISEDAFKELEAIWSRGPLDPQEGFEFPRLSFHMGRWIRHGGWYPDRQLRFFHRPEAQWHAGHVHERVRSPKVRRLNGSLRHWPFTDLSDQVQTNNRYSSLGAQDLFDRGVRFSYIKIVCKPISKFIETYCLKMGFLDGFPGFVIAVGAAYSVFLKFAKLKELQRKI